ncbi:MAG TPA: hypothetical protein VM934_01650 [Pyrinomonadaceae bacterium]|nr:hypothetical protein [Pyrinomonadaceae bacterium]
MRHTLRFSIRKIFLLIAASLCLLASAPLCPAQSGDAGFPTPVRSREVAGRIPPRDLGDARRTRHFYSFGALEGDLSVTVEGADLIGDVDVFTANTFRPLLKVTLYGGATRATKSVYLRREEALILRVEARAVGDTDGSYTIRFGGSFAPAPESASDAPATDAPAVAGNSDRSDRSVRRVTSTGARIEEPVAERPTAGDEASATPTERAPVDAPANERPGGARETSRRRAGRNSRSPTSTGTRRRASPPAASPKTSDRTETPADADTASANSTADEKPADSNTTRPARPARNSRARPPRTPKRSTTSTGRSETANNADNTSPDAAQPASTQRLIIVTRDGETLERDMSTVRRVTVENNQLVIVSKDGRVVRQPMSNVLRMTIEP